MKNRIDFLLLYYHLFSTAKQAPQLSNSIKGEILINPLIEITRDMTI